MPSINTTRTWDTSIFVNFREILSAECWGKFSMVFITKSSGPKTPSPPSICGKHAPVSHLTARSGVTWRRPLVRAASAYGAELTTHRRLQRLVAAPSRRTRPPLHDCANPEPRRQWRCGRRGVRSDSSDLNVLDAPEAGPLMVDGGDLDGGSAIVVCNGRIHVHLKVVATTADGVKAVR